MTDLRAPDSALLDEAVPVRATGVDPGRRVTLRARRESDPDDGGVAATFEADAEGVVDPAERAPVAGDYDGVRPMGLFQFRPRDDRGPDDGPIRVTVSALVEGRVVASTTVERRVFAAGVERTDVDAPDLVGDLYRPPGDGPSPGVVLLGGSEGGRPSSLLAGLLASRGYAVLGLAYFGADGLPDELLDVPVEYLDRTVEWFGDREDVRSSPLGAIGISRGGEPALTLGARRPEVRTVVGIAASPVRFQGLSQSGSVGGSLAEDGDSLPYVPFRWGPEQQRAIGEAAQSGEPFSYVPAYRGGLEDADAGTVEAATIPVEQVGGPILLVSGGDDRTWNAPELGELAVERLDERGYDYPYEHVVYEDAGHAIGPPYCPVEGRTAAGDPSGLRMALGGTPEGYADADSRAWDRLLETLDRGLRRPRPAAER